MQQSLDKIDNAFSAKYELLIDKLSKVNYSGRLFIIQVSHFHMLLPMQIYQVYQMRVQQKFKDLMMKLLEETIIIKTKIMKFIMQIQNGMNGINKKLNLIYLQIMPKEMQLKKIYEKIEIKSKIQYQITFQSLKGDFQVYYLVILEDYLEICFGLQDMI